MASGGDRLASRGLRGRGDPASVDRLRSVNDAGERGRFAERWYADPSPNTRRRLLGRLPRAATRCRSPRGARRAALRAGRGGRRRCHHGARGRSTSTSSACGATAPRGAAAGRSVGVGGPGRSGQRLSRGGGWPASEPAARIPAAPGGD